jgi:hypothetical protein
MEIDKFGHDEYFDDDLHKSVTSRRLSQTLIKKSVAKTYLTKEEFRTPKNTYKTGIRFYIKLFVNFW